ncbi:MAG: hypothetical protein U0745_00325 [Polyangia bacterium]
MSTDAEKTLYNLRIVILSRREPMKTHVNIIRWGATICGAALGLFTGSASAQQRVALGDTALHGGSRDARASRSEPTVTVEPLDHLPRLRPVLRGAMYRSGTPSEAALSHLCERGWKRVYSLYGEHTTQTGPRNVSMLRTGRDVRSCQSEGSPRSIEWRSAPSARLRTLPNIFRDVLESIRNPDKGPVLVHCWNGLHYAGMVSALALRQFCGFSAEQAEAYWRTNANRGANYPLIIANIHNFKPIAGLSLTAAEQQALCPDVSMGYMLPTDNIVAAALIHRGRGGSHNPPIPPLRNAVESSEGSASTVPMTPPARSSHGERAPVPASSSPSATSGATSENTPPPKTGPKFASRSS